jgi:hypothetical protein
MLASLIVSACGFAGMIAGSILAQTAPGSDFGPWVSGGSASIAVGALVYMARALTTGRLVARDTQAETEHLKELVRETAELARKVTSVAEAGADRERTLHNLLVERWEQRSGRHVPREDER